mgnify:CR=1 FL=1
MIPHLEQAVDANLRHEGGKVVAPNLIELRYDYESYTRMGAPRREFLERELTQNIYEYIYNRRYQTLGQMQVKIAYDAFTRGLEVRAEFGDAKPAILDSPQFNQQLPAIEKSCDVMLHSSTNKWQARATIKSSGDPAGIGRNSANAIQIDDSTVSNFHAAFVLRPAGSDGGTLELADGRVIAIADTRKGKADDGSFNDDICHLPAPELLATLLNSEQTPDFRLAVGDRVTARIDWARRLRLMRFHTTTHLLCHLVPQLVNGCSITPDYARLDFNMTDALDKEALTAGLARLVAAALPVTVGAITDEELDATPELVKSMSVQPPRGSGRIRTIRIGDAALIDLQPCGGTHVANTSEIGAVVVTKIEKKSATTRRVVLGFAA